MNRPVISVENLGKVYRIATAQQHYSYKSIREVVTNAVMKPLRGLRDKRKDKPAAKQTFWALRNVSFTVTSGEVVGIIGKNGAGKSTLLKVASRITDPTEGRVRTRGRIGSLLEVGTGFHPELTGRENVYLSGAILGMKKTEIERRFDEIVAFSEVERFLDTPIKHYSSGMYLRLAFSVAAHLQPDILFVDEVLAVGDASFQQKCIRKMGEVAKDGRTVLFVSHNMGAVSTLCSRVIHMAAGSIAADGAPREVIQGFLPKQTDTTAKELHRLRVPGYGRTVRFVDVGLGSRDGANFFFQEPLAFRFRIESEERHAGLSIGGTIFNVLGAGIGTLFTSETFDIDPGETLELLLTVENLNLAPDYYHAGFSIGRGGASSARQDLDIIIGEPSFQVLPVSAADSHITQWNLTSWGNIVIVNTSLTVNKSVAREA